MGLGVAPALESAVSCAKDPIAALTPIESTQNRHCGRGQRHFVREAVFGPLGSNAPHGVLEVDFQQKHPTNLLAPLAGQDEQSEDRAIVAGSRQSPDERQFLWR